MPYDKIEHYRDSNLIKYNYQAINQDLLIELTNYENIYDFQYNLNNHLFNLLKDMNYLRYPENDTMFHVELGENPVYIPNQLTSSKNMDFDEGSLYLLAILTNYYPLGPRIKPGGIIFEDFSYLQIDVTLAQDLETKKLYLLFYSIHYGRRKNGTDQYFFRFDLESNFQHNPNSLDISQLNFKPPVHFHGNADDPHFKDTFSNLFEKLSEIIHILRCNLERLDIKFPNCDQELP